MPRFLKIIRLRLLQVELDGFEIAGNVEAARRIAPEEARLRAEVTAL